MAKKLSSLYMHVVIQEICLYAITHNKAECL